jgi:hypothetical protein
MPLRRLLPGIEATLEAEGAQAPPKKRYRRPNGHGRMTAEQRRHQPSDEMRRTISNMCSYGLDVLTISKLAGISSATIYKYYRHEMMTSAANKDLIVLQSAFLKAIGGPEQNWEKADAGLQKWWIACRQRWAPPAEKTVNANFNMDLSRLTDRQLDELERIMEAAAMDDRGDSAGEIGEAEQAQRSGA